MGRKTTTTTIILGKKQTKNEKFNYNKMKHNDNGDGVGTLDQCSTRNK